MFYDYFSLCLYNFDRLYGFSVYRNMIDFHILNLNVINLRHNRARLTFFNK